VNIENPQVVPQIAYLDAPDEFNRRDVIYCDDGLSLRDFFAAKALQMIVFNDVSGRPENFREFYSEGAYKWADAMLLARHKTITTNEGEK